LIDRVKPDPYDTHTWLTHRNTLLYSAACDGCFEALIIDNLVIVQQKDLHSISGIAVDSTILQNVIDIKY